MRPKDSKKQTEYRKIRVGKLDTLKEVAKLQGRLIKKALRAGGDANVEYKIVCMATMLAKTLESSDLEKRVEALEQQTRKV
jgi:hypothetical protein